MGEIGYIFNLIFTFPILNGLLLLYQLFNNDFGLSIIVLTIIVRLILFPLTLQQLKSSKATQAIQPQITELREKYKKDPKAQQAALSALYKESGVNPVAGCLPLLIQMPVIYGLYFALRTILLNPTLKGINSLIYPFLPLLQKFSESSLNLNWFTFINASWHISLGVPDPTHILPILAGLATFIQLRMSQPRTNTNPNSKSSPNAMAQQMQIMQFMMPVITIFIGWTFAAGLALYWTTTSVFGMVQQYFVTGWGSLLVLPSFLGGGGGKANNNARPPVPQRNGQTSYTGDQRKESQLLRRATEPEVEDSISNGKGPVGRNLRTNASSSSRRRARGGTSSARRRGSPNRARG